MVEPRRSLLDIPLVAAPLSALLWAGDVAIVIAWTPAVALFRLLTRGSDPNRNRVGRLMHSSAAFAARINPYWDFRVIDDVRPDVIRPYLFVCNHKSLADVFLLSMLPWNTKFLSKDSIFKIPLLGWQMRVAGDIPLERGDKESARRALGQMRERLLAKSSVIVFPEGTRSAEGTVGPFRDGAFRLAIELGVDVVPLAIREPRRPCPSTRFASAGREPPSPSCLRFRRPGPTPRPMRRH